MEKKKMLLHSCCGPCSTSVIERLKNDYDLTVFYYNPNVYPEKEYLKRLNEQKRYLELSCQDIAVVDGEYVDNKVFCENFKGLEDCPEGGARCSKCFYLRLKKTAEYAKKNGFNIFATTLSVSPHKNAEVINSIGKTLENQVGIEFLEADFKKKDGYLNSIKLSKQFGLYRQKYCGCKFSIYDQSLVEE